MTRNTKINDSNNYFSLLGLPVSFEIDKKRLSQNYHELQKTIHPDKFANASDRDRLLSVQKAAQINDALQTLKNPLQRSIYLLTLFGIELGENDATVDPAFLMEQMELREALSQVNDKADPLVALDDILDDVKVRIKSAVNNLVTLFGRILAEDTPEEEQQKLLDDVKSQVLKMQFLNRLQEEAMNKEEDLANQL